MRSKLRDVVRRSKAPASPGSRLAGLLNSLFANAVGKQRKLKPSLSDAGDSCWSAAPAHSRPCLLKKPSSRRGAASENERPRRSVRFHPVSVVMGEDRQPQRQKMMCRDKLPEPSSAVVREVGLNQPAATREAKAKEEARWKVEDISRRFEVEEDKEEEDVMSDSSSDLFELENLTDRGGGGGGVYRESCRCM